jgi:hypothetical protein
MGARAQLGWMFKQSFSVQFRSLSMSHFAEERIPSATF